MNENLKINNKNSMAKKIMQMHAPGVIEVYSANLLP